MNSGTARFTDYSQFALRQFLAVGFILPVLDRLGLLGAVGQFGNAWGNWSNFVTYTHSLMPYVSTTVSAWLGALATVLELGIALVLIPGWKIRIAAIASCILTLLFALSMLVFAGFRSPFSYSVFSISAASLMLAGIQHFRWSVDARMKMKKVPQ